MQHLLTTHYRQQGWRVGVRGMGAPARRARGCVSQAGSNGLLQQCQLPTIRLERCSSQGLWRLLPGAPGEFW